MKMQKATATLDKNKIALTFPIVKVDESRRVVSGFATLNNVDAHDDLVLSSASAQAFANWRGNIREMHQPLAVGKALDIVEQQFFDPQTGQLYDGVFVDAYISLGAEDTWQKVLDGTLTGFSIGGNIIKASSEYMESLNKVVRLIIEYELLELSLVDNPANPLANILSFQKNADGVDASGIIADLQIENVFFCKDDNSVVTSSESSMECGSCKKLMSEIGFIESMDNKTEKIKDLLNGLEGGVTMEETPVEVEATETVEKTSTPEEVAAPDFQKMISELQESIAANILSVSGDTEKVVKELSSKVDDVTTSLTAKFDELAAGYKELTNKFNSLTGGIDGVEKRLGSLESNTAMRKSVESGSTEIEKPKSLWSGAFLSANKITE